MNRTIYKRRQHAGYTSFGQQAAISIRRRKSAQITMQRLAILSMAAIILLGVVMAAVTADTTASPAKAIPSSSELKKAVLRYFQAQPDYHDGDLLTQDKVEPLLAQLRQMGLPLSDGKEILADVHAKDDFLAEQLRTPNGRKFMRRISGYPDGYDRLDRLARLPHGQQTIRDLIRGPDGYKMIEYMTTTPGGTALGSQLSNCAARKRFQRCHRTNLHSRAALAAIRAEPHRGS